MKTREEAAKEGAAQVLAGIGCAPILSIPVIFGFALLFGIIFGNITLGLIIGVIVALLMVFGGFITLGRAAFGRTIPISCPYCGVKNSAFKRTVTFDCKECKQKVVIRNGIGEKL